MKFIRMATTLFLVLFPKVSVTAQQMPTEVHENLGKLVGTWQVKTTIDNKPVTETVTLEWSSDQNTLRYDGKGKNFQTGESETFSGILGWDGTQKLVVERGFNSLGGTMTATLAVKGNTWKSPTKSTDIVNGKITTETSDRIFKWKSDDQWSLMHTNQRINGKTEQDRISVFRKIRNSSDPAAKRLVRDEIERFKSCWKESNAELLAQEFSHDGIRAINTRTLPIVGHEAIQKSFEEGFSAGQRDENATIDAKVIHAEFITDKHIMADGTWWLTEADGTVSRTGKWGNIWVVNDDHTNAKLLMESAYADLPLEKVADRKVPKRGHALPAAAEIQDAELAGMIQRHVKRYMAGASTADSKKIAREFTTDGIRIVSEMPRAYRGRPAIFRSLKIANEGSSPYANRKLEVVVLNARRLDSHIAIANGVWQVTEKDGSIIDFGQWGNVLEIKGGGAKLLLESAGSYEP